MNAVRLRLATVMVTALLVQITWFSQLRPFGVAPELPLLVAVYCGQVAGSERGATAAFFMGLLYDVQHPTPFGLWALTGCVVAYFMGNLGENLHRPTGIVAAVSTGVASAVGVVGFALGASILGQAGLVNLRLVRVALLVGLWNLLLSPVVGRVIRWCYQPSDAVRVTT